MGGVATPPHLVWGVCMYACMYDVWCVPVLLQLPPWCLLQPCLLAHKQWQGSCACLGSVGEEGAGGGVCVWRAGRGGGGRLASECLCVHGAGLTMELGLAHMHAWLSEATNTRAWHDISRH